MPERTALKPRPGGEPSGSPVQTELAGGRDDVLLPEALAAELAGLFSALSEPARARIVFALLHGERTTSNLGALLGISLPSVSQHLRLLRMLRIVKPRRDGRLVYYSLDDAHIRLLLTLSLTHLREESATRESSE